MLITHPFHPLSGRTFHLVGERVSRHGDRIWFTAEDGRVDSVPREWTSLRWPDPFEALSGGRVRFRPHDLVELAALVENLRLQCGRLGQREAEADV